MALQFSFTALCSVHPSLPAARSVTNITRSSKHFRSFVTYASRRSANYKPNIWDDHFVQSLTSDYQGWAYARHSEKLTEEVRLLLQEMVEPLARLELIDTIQRLGVGHLFNKEIEEALHAIWVCNVEIDNDLYATALQFRLLRQHGYHVPQDVFNKFKDERGNFIAGLFDNIKGMLSLYEASHLTLQGENVMEECKAFTRIHLKAFKGNNDIELCKKVEHALEVPLHWRISRLEARWYLKTFENEEHMNPTLLELAKLDFNMVQAIHQRDLRKASRWWTNVGLKEKLRFSRDRLLECFFVGLGLTFESQFGYCRVHLAKIAQFITIIDDIYDVYGSLNELECFTDAIDRWDVESMEQLPEYMKVCFLALNNATNEMGYDILKEKGLNIIPHQHKVWAIFCKAMLVEAKWYSSGYRPSLQEYLNNAWISSSAPVILVHALFLSRKTITREVLDCLKNNQNLIRWTSIIARLCNDLATYTDEQERGDCPSSIQCYMYEANVSEIEARDHIKDMITDTWNNLNEELIVGSPLPLHFINLAFNLARVFHCIYQYGDGHTIQHRENKDRIESLLVQPIPLK